MSTQVYSKVLQGVWSQEMAHHWKYMEDNNNGPALALSHQIHELVYNRVWRHIFYEISIKVDHESSGL